MKGSDSIRSSYRGSKAISASGCYPCRGCHGAVGHPARERSSGQERLAKSPLVGKLAPSIDGTTTTGEKFTLDRLRGQWVVVNFFGSWCTPCIQEHPELVTFSERHRAARDATVVTVAFSDSPTSVQRFFEERGGTWPVLARETSGIAVAYGVIKVPGTYLVAPTQLIVAKLVGGVTADGLDALLAKYSAPAGTR